MNDNLVLRLGMIALAFPLVSCVSASTFYEPMDDSTRRATPLNFGRHVTPDPATNPISPPERFTGFHAATDFEVTDDELEKDVPVYSICRGRVLYSGYAEGYGGLLVQKCRLQGKPVTVLYGHMLIDSLPRKGVTLRAQDRVGILAPARSYDSGGNRKHLHLGIHRGDALDYRGYVETEEQLKSYMNPQDFLPASPIESMLPQLTPYWQETGTGSTDG